VIAIRTFNGHDLFSCVAGDASATGKWINFLSVVSPAHSTLCTGTHCTAILATFYFHAFPRPVLVLALDTPWPVLPRHRYYHHRQALTTGSGRVGKKNSSGRRGRAVSWSDECESFPSPFRVSKPSHTSCSPLYNSYRYGD